MSTGTRHPRAEPDRAAQLAERGRRLAQLGRLEAAAGALRAAVAADPERADLHNDLGTVLAMQGRLDAALQAFHDCLARSPTHRQALGNAATALERANRLEELDELLSAALTAHPQDPVLALVAGKLAARRGEFDQARTRLEAVAGSGQAQLAREAAYALGHLYDRAGRYAEADALFERANALWRSAHPQAALEAERFVAELRALGRQLAEWQPPPLLPSDPPDPVFLLGFPRSGNTLLATMLESHGAFRVLDEKPALETMWAQLAVGLPELPRALAATDPARRRALRESFWREAGQSPGAGARLVDKSPLASIYAGLIPSVFPHARIVFVSRHPHDVALSCYMHDFPPSRAAGALDDIETIAGLYAAVLDVWHASMGGGLDHLVVRYEDLVTRPEPTLRQLLEFVGAGWSDSALQFHARGVQRARQRTPNYANVSRPLYSTALRRRQHYAERIAPACGVLEPYRAALGY